MATVEKLGLLRTLSHSTASAVPPPVVDRTPFVIERPLPTLTTPPAEAVA